MNLYDVFADELAEILDEIDAGDADYVSADAWIDRIATRLQIAVADWVLRDSRFLIVDPDTDIDVDR